MSPAADLLEFGISLSCSVQGSFAAQANGWRWPIWELLWISSFALVAVTFLLPETLADNILLKRAQRLRKLTGNENLQSASEIKQAEMTAKDLAVDSLVRPFQLMVEPAVLFINLYISRESALFVARAEEHRLTRSFFSSSRICRLLL